jgi:integrase
MPKFVEGFADKLVVPQGARDVQVFDDEMPGFGIRKFAGGKASYFVKFAVGTQQRRLTLGRVTRGNLKTMRLEASKILAKARLGQDIVAEKQAAATKPQAAALGMLVLRYLDARKADLRPRSYVEVERYLERYWAPLHSLAVESIRRADVVAVIDTIETNNGKVAADKARTALSTFFAWCIDRGTCETNPTLAIRARSSHEGRSRVLSESELVEVWRASLDDAYGRIVRLLILLGQRRREIGDLSWSEIVVSGDGTRIELPEQRTKNGRAHIVPLSAAAVQILPDRPGDILSRSVFGRTGDSGFTGWGPAKARLDERIAQARAAAGVRQPMKSWVLHDLRRSVVTHLGELRLAHPHVIEAIVNHVSGHKGGVAGVYNRASYLVERREALQRWAEHISTLVGAG